MLFILLFSRSLADFDFWGCLSFGRFLWENGYFPYQDVFSYTPTKPVWVYHEWLTGVILYPLFKYLGPAGVQLLRYVLIVSTILIMYLAAVKRGATAPVSFIMISIGLILISWGYTPVIRAQIFTYLFFALSIFLAECARKESKYFLLLWLLPIHALWCNLHGGFIAGLGLIALYALGEGLSGRRFTPFVLIFAGSCLATLVNPYGVDYWRYLLDAVAMPRPDITEWHSVFRSIQAKTFVAPALLFLFLSVISIFAIISHGKKYLTELLIFVALTYLGMKHIRHTVFLGISFGVFMPVIMKGISDRVSNNAFILKKRCTKSLTLFFFYLMSVLLVYMLPSTAKINKPSDILSPTFSLSAPSLIFPSGALKWLKNSSFKGNILSSFNWGQYIIWNTYPHCKVAFDGRYETVYPIKIQREYFNYLNGHPEWKGFLENYPHDAVILTRNAKVHLLMLKEPEWQRVYFDQGSVLFLKKTQRITPSK